MPVDVTTEIVIGRPLEEVAAFTAEPDHAPRWYTNIQSVEWQTSPPLEVGSKIAFVARFLGRRLSDLRRLEDLLESGEAGDVSSTRVD